jgi:hypothetical protein
MSKQKIDLSLLKRLVAELESSLSTVENMETDIPASKNELIVEASKAAGLAAGVMQEASMLMGDIHALVEGSMTPKGKNEFLEKLLGSLKGPGNTN